MATQRPGIRVRTADGKPREWKEMHSALGGQTYIRGYPVEGNVEFVIAADSPKQIDSLREVLAAAGLQEMVGGDTTIPKPFLAKSKKPTQRRRGYAQHNNGGTRHPQRPGTASTTAASASHATVNSRTTQSDLRERPYGFVSLPDKLTTAKPIWHDGTTPDLLSGEIRFELEALTPLLVGWERQALNENEEVWTIPVRKVSSEECASAVQAVAKTIYPDATASGDTTRRQNEVKEARLKYVNRVQDRIVDVQVQGAGLSIDSKSVLSPLRAPWGKRPVIIPGDTLKGLLRHELGALLGAPMERVAERSYSYRPNALFPKDGPRLIPRIARVPSDGVEMKELYDKTQDHAQATLETKVRVPTKLELLPMNLQYDKKSDGKWTRTSDYYRFDDGNGATYRGGQGAGEKLNSKRPLHSRLTANPNQPTEIATLSPSVQEGYLKTIRHLVDEASGHFSERHPDAKEHGANARARILDAAQSIVFRPGDLIWVEWDVERNCIVSFGWHYYYRWAYLSSVRKVRRQNRCGLFPLEAELEHEGGAPAKLSVVRRLFGYTGDNEGSKEIGHDDHTQLMGRLFPNAAIEVVGDNETDDDRFLGPTFLKELGMPRPSAVEYYLKQPHHPTPRPSDDATLVTYGDAEDYDEPGELAGRKFYLDRRDAYDANGNALVPGPAADASDANRLNERSTLALEASKPGRRFRFTVRFRDLERRELAAVLIALCPDQFKAVLGGTHADGYCSKLGYARPLGWGSVRIEAQQLLLLDDKARHPVLTPEANLTAWVENAHEQTESQVEWLDIHRRNHPDASDYQRDAHGNIYTFHTRLRASHSRARRNRNAHRQ